MENMVFGIRPVAEAIESGQQIERLYIRKGGEGQLLSDLRDLALRHRVRMQEVPVEKLNRLVKGNHQGVVAQISPIEYVTVEDIMERVPEDETPLIVIFDGVTDVRNFGAIARSAECAGAHGLIAPLKNAAPVNAEAMKSSAGALARIPVWRPTAIVMGSEEKGISKEVLKLCNEQLAIPLIGAVESLNVSAAAAVMLFEVVRQRIGD